MGDEYYSLYYQNNMLYKAKIIEFDKKTNFVLVQFINFNMRQLTNENDLYYKSQIDIENIENIDQNQYNIGKKCKIINEDKIECFEIEQIEWKKMEMSNTNGYKYIIYIPLYTLISQDGQIMFLNIKNINLIEKILRKIK